MKGRILKGVGGYYTVLADNGEQYTLKARGRFRLDEQTPYPGDYVEFEPTPEGTDGAMFELLPRKNLLLRPKVANVDLVLAVISATMPEPDLMLLDKLCANTYGMEIKTVVAMNKTDLVKDDELNWFLKDYAAFSPILCSVPDNKGIGEIKNLTLGKVSCFAGQSGVGKSSIINAMLPDLELETGELSEKTERGKHTTRHAELLLHGKDTMIVDTPGFSLMELPAIEPEMVGEYYPEFQKYLGHCRFTGCMHDSEPGCAIKAAVESGEIPKARWERYLVILKDIRQKWRDRY